MLLGGILGGSSGMSLDASTAVFLSATGISDSIISVARFWDADSTGSFSDFEHPASVVASNSMDSNFMSVLCFLKFVWERRF